MDDVFDSLLEASDAGTSIFAHPLFRFLREVHETFDARVALYVFLEAERDGRRRSLSEVSSALQAELAAAPWISFGPHGLDYAHPPYSQSRDGQLRTFEAIYREIDRLAGRQRRSPWVRLHSFSEAFDLSDYWLRQGVTTLLLTDKPSVSYRLPADLRAELAARGFVQHEGLTLRRSHERLEALPAGNGSSDAVRLRLDEHLRRHGSLVLFSHEGELAREDVQSVTRVCLAHARDRGLTCVGGATRA